MTTPIVCPVAYGEPGARALSIWHSLYRDSGSTLPVVVLTDDTPHPCVVQTCTTRSLPLLAVNARRDMMWCTHQQQVAGWIKAHAFCAVGHVAPVIAIDCDIAVLAPIDELARDMLSQGKGLVGMCPDPGRRSHRKYPECGEELNSGLLWVDRIGFNSQYADEWHGSRGSQRPVETPWFDEMATTAVMRSYGDAFVEMPRIWNYSHWWLGDEMAGEAKAVHYHGNNGKAKLLAYARERGLA